MGRKLRKIFIILVALLFALSLFMVLKQLYNYYMGDRAYSDAMEIAGVVFPTEMPEILPEIETDADNWIEADNWTEPEEWTEPEDGIEPENGTEPDAAANPQTAAKSETAAKSDTGTKPQTGTKSETSAKSKAEPKSEPVKQISFEEAIASIDLDALRVYNSDIVGWIAVPYTVLSYPIVQGSDNDYYLNHTWNKKYSSVGSIFLEHSVSPDFSDFNTLIFGHHMGNGTMFNSLTYYADYNYWKANPRIYIVTDDGIRCYDIYSTYEASVNSITYAIDVTESDIKQEFIKHTVDSSVIDTGIVPEEDDLILTLSTCTRRGGKSTRWVVHAVLSENE